MKRKKTKLTPEFWKRDAANRRDLARRVAALEAKLGSQSPLPEQPQP